MPIFEGIQGCGAPLLGPLFKNPDPCLAAPDFLVRHIGPGSLVKQALKILDGPRQITAQGQGKDQTVLVAYRGNPVGDIPAMN